ncbi:MAG TPA: tannase/feruloyl esterase family alpha/beta hydrolase [Micromonosporaceae bacterium]|jgi:feruloyl esterase
MQRTGAALTALLLATAIAFGGSAAPVAAAPAGAPVIGCADLTGSGGITSATTVTSSGHQYCDVHAVINAATGAPIHAEIKLPTTGWHGQYVQEGCGGLCGTATVTDFPSVGYGCAPAINGQIALAADDTGHADSDVNDGSWGRTDVAARVAFGLTSEHRLARYAKTVIARYYGHPPAYSYFDGCSTGGRQALMLAQRYPDDFDGILAGSAAANLAPLSGMLDPWLIRANTGSDGHAILTAEKLPALHAAVMKRCADSDGVVVDPRRCDFQPASIRCHGTDGATCLTPAQVDAVRKFYLGPTDTAGNSLYNGGMPYGSELGWTATFIAPAADRGAPADTPDGRIALSYLKDLGYLRNPPAGYTLYDVQFTDHAFAALNVLGDAIYNANDPDLTAFRAHGGRLLLYHGLADPAIPPWSTIDYYAAVERTMGGYAASQSFSRLYLIPGGYHCLIGPDYTDPTQIALPELLTPLMAWVQRGVAPGRIPAPIVALADNSVLVDQAVSPYDALAPVRSAPGSLNGHYHYIGQYGHVTG